MHRGSVKLFDNPTVDQQLVASRSNFPCRYLSCSIICPKITHFGHQPSWWKPKTERTLTVTSYWLHCVRFDGSAVPQSANWAGGRWPLGLHHLLSLMKRWQFNITWTSKFGTPTIRDHPIHSSLDVSWLVLTNRDQWTWLANSVSPRPCTSVL